MGAMMRDEPTAEYVRGALSYDPLTGDFTWKRRDDRSKTWNTRYAGKTAGTRHSEGYNQIILRNICCFGHRIAWAYMTGAWPDKSIDHIDGNRSNNRWANLRLCDQSQNNANSRIPKTNTSGYKGVTWDKKRRLWRAGAKHKQKFIFIGHYANKEDAHAAYCAKAKELFGEFARAA